MESQRWIHKNQMVLVLRSQDFDVEPAPPAQEGVDGNELTDMVKPEMLKDRFPFQPTKTWDPTAGSSGFFKCLFKQEHHASLYKYGEFTWHEIWSILKKNLLSAWLICWWWCLCRIFSILKLKHGHRLSQGIPPAFCGRVQSLDYGEQAWDFLKPLLSTDLSGGNYIWKSNAE